MNDFVVCTPFSIRQKVWDFWHANSEESTLTTQLAKLHTTEKPKCQSDLDFDLIVKVVNKHNRSFYQSIWKVTGIPMLSMYQKYMEQNPDSRVSKGTFFNLKPFYIRGASQKDIQICLCKLHLHTQWSFQALLEGLKLWVNPLTR